VVLWLALWIGALSVGMDISGGRLWATLGAVLLALAYGAIAVLLSAATGRRALAIGVTAAAAVAATSSAASRRSSTRSVPQKLSPFYHYAAGDPLRRGVSISLGRPGRNRGRGDRAAPALLAP
jgi:ABC-2 type transport system permease protein